ncbi:MAG TPA: hypothetical protein VG055_23870 [Planctomycetaceae bacterium]|jgi:hypothetical protein|nr:hypothetical protein [Planctomycetaceae bacterium]
MSDEPKTSEVVPAWQAGWRMTEAVMPERPSDHAWRKRLAFHILTVFAALALGPIISAIFWSAVGVVGVILMWLFGAFSPQRW